MPNWLQKTGIGICRISSGTDNILIYFFDYRRPKRGEDLICTERVSKHGIFKMYAEIIMMDNNLDVPLLYRIVFIYFFGKVNYWVTGDI